MAATSFRSPHRSARTCYGRRRRDTRTGRDIAGAQRNLFLDELPGERRTLDALREPIESVKFIYPVPERK